jgi:predicted nuclease of predicted toxin-antitoxin system
VRAKLDEDLSKSVSNHLRRYGIEVRTVREQGWGGLQDSQLWPKLRDEKVLFVTADKGFGDLRAYPPGNHGGILLLRADTQKIAEFCNLIDLAIAKHPLDTLHGALVVATARSVRIRRIPLK